MVLEDMENYPFQSLQETQLRKKHPTRNSKIDVK